MGSNAHGVNCRARRSMVPIHFYSGHAAIAAGGLQPAHALTRALDKAKDMDREAKAVQTKSKPSLPGTKHLTL